MRVQRRVLRAVWLQVVGTRAGFGGLNASLFGVARKLCPTIQTKSESMLVSYMPLAFIYRPLHFRPFRAIPLSCGARGGTRRLRASQ